MNLYSKLFILLVGGVVLIGMGCQDGVTKEIADNFNSQDYVETDFSPSEGEFRGFKFSLKVPTGWGELTEGNFSSSSTKDLEMFVFPDEENVDFRRFPAVSIIVRSEPLDQELVAKALAKRSTINFSQGETGDGKITELGLCYTEPTFYCERYIALDSKRSVYITDYSHRGIFRTFSFRNNTPSSSEGVLQLEMK